MAKDYSNVAGVVGAVSNKVDEVATRIGQEVAFAAPMWQSVVDKAYQALESGADFISDTGETISGAVDTVGQVASRAASVGSQVVDRATGMASDLVSSMDEVDSSIVNQGDVPEGTRMTALGKGVGSAAEDIYEALPEMDDVVEGVQDAATAVVDTAKTGYKYFKAVTSPVAMNFLDDFLLGRARTAVGIDPIPGSNEFFSDETITLLKTMIKDRGGLKAGETMSFDKKVYSALSKKYGSKIRVVQTGGSDSEEIIDALANRNPADEVKNILGSFTVSADEEGNLTIEDRFNYNEWKHPVTEKEYNKAEFDKAIEDGEFSRSEMVGKSWEVYGSSYGFVRSLGFLFGSQDSGEEGRKDGRLFKLNLGNLKDL